MKQKRILALLTAVGMCLSYFSYAPVMMPEVVLTASAAEYSGTCGEDITWKLENGILTISGTGEMLADYERSPFEYMDDVSQIIIEDGVTSIGNSAFWECTSLTSITIPDSVTSIGDSAFEECESLTSITIPNSVTSIGDSAFLRCASLESVTIPDSVTDIGAYAFQWTPWLAEKQDQNPFVIVNGILIDGSACSDDITIPDSVMSIGDSAFNDCSSLISVIIPDSVTSIGNWSFYGCSWLKSITIPDSVTSIGDYAFSRCTLLTSITIPDSVTSIGDYAFSRCSWLKSITIPDSMTSIGNSVFEDCSELTIKGYKGSCAETYAGENDIPFEVITETAETVVTEIPDLAPVLWGDATGDGSVDIADAVLLAKYLVGNPDGNISEQGKANANLIKGTLDIDDISALLMLIAKMITPGQLPLDGLPVVKD